jgi:SHS2 domain-containing protein
MSYGWAEHVGELELRVRATDEAAVFVEALHALAELLGEVNGAPVGGREWLEVTAEGQDRALLLAAWLEELSFVAETQGFMPETVDDLTLEPGRITARVGGRRGSPPHLVKAVTYHRLAFEPAGDGWDAVAVLDV